MALFVLRLATLFKYISVKIFTAVLFLVMLRAWNGRDWGGLNGDNESSDFTTSVENISYTFLDYIAIPVNG